MLLLVEGKTVLRRLALDLGVREGDAQVVDVEEPVERLDQELDQQVGGQEAREA